MTYVFSFILISSEIRADLFSSCPRLFQKENWGGGGGGAEWHPNVAKLNHDRSIFDISQYFTAIVLPFTLLYLLKMNYFSMT